jgi:antitoxin HicB
LIFTDIKKGGDMHTHYPATISEQYGGGYLVEFVDLPDTFTEGETLEAALFNGAEVLTAMLAWHIEQGHDIPSPTEGLANAHYIAPDAKVQAVLLLKHARAGRSLADIARAMQTSWPQVKRLEDATHWPSLKTIDRAARVLGKRLVLRFE